MTNEVSSRVQTSSVLNSRPPCAAGLSPDKTGNRWGFRTLGWLQPYPGSQDLKPYQAKG